MIEPPTVKINAWKGHATVWKVRYCIPKWIIVIIWLGKQKTIRYTMVYLYKVIPNIPYKHTFFKQLRFRSGPPASWDAVQVAALVRKIWPARELSKNLIEIRFQIRMVFELFMLWFTDLPIDDLRIVTDSLLITSLIVKHWEVLSIHAAPCPLGNDLQGCDEWWIGKNRWS